jgi:hypothetical protein
MNGKSKRTVSWPLVFVLLLALVACGLSSRKEAPPAPKTSDESGYAMPAAPSESADKPGTGALAGAPAVQRLIVKTAEFRILVETVEGVEPKLQKKVEELGGFIVRAEKTGSGDEASLTFTFRVPADKFDAAVAAVEALATRVDYRKIGGG